MSSDGRGAEGSTTAIPLPPPCWTPAEAPLFAQEAQRALVAQVGDGAWSRAGAGGFAVEVQVETGEIVLALRFASESATLALVPDPASEHRWRESWMLEIVDANRVLGWLTAGGPPLVIAEAQLAEVRARLRIAPRTLVRPLDGSDHVVSLVDVGFHRYTRQSSGHGAAPEMLQWANATAAETAPWWELDIGEAMYLSRIRIDLGPLPHGTRVAVQAYGFFTPSGEPPPNSVICERTLEESTTGRVETGDVVARYVRVTAVAPPGDVVTLAVTATEILATPLYADTLVETLRRAFAIHADRALFVDRDRDGGFRPHLRFREVWERAMALGRGIARRLEPSPGRIVVGIMTRNRPEWVMADLASLVRGYLIVPISPEESDQRLSQIVARAQPACVICEADQVGRLGRIAGACLRLLVVCDGNAAGSVAIGFETVVAEGAKLTALPTGERDEDDVHSVLFTSGSTGAAKGAMRSYRGFHALLRSYPLGHSPRHLSFQPLAHLSERMYLPAVMIHGGTIGFSRGGAQLLGELRGFEPTTLGSVPRLYEVLYANYQRRMLAAFAAAPATHRAEVEARGRSETRAAFGSRLLAVSVGSAPVGADVLGFLRQCFADIWVSEGYGSTEVGSIAFDGNLLAHVEVELRPVAGEATEMPSWVERGEIWVKTPHIVAGYFGDPDATAAAIDHAGFFATGDLGERDPDGRIRVIGRVRNTVKLAQGEFVSAERIEAGLATAAVVDQIYVHVVPGMASVVALVIPHAETLARLLGFAAAPLAELNAHPAATAAVLAAVRQHGRSAGLAGYELPHRITLEAEALTADNGGLTASGKLARVHLAARYGPMLDVLVNNQYAAVEGTTANDDLADRVLRAVSRVLGRAIDPREPLSDAVADSLAAAEILAALAEVLGHDVPLAWWFGAATLEDLTARLEKVPPDEPPSAVAVQVAADLSTAAPAPQRMATRSPVETVLLTGATGFLGAHLVEALRARDVRVICFVRARDGLTAAARLTSRLAALAVPVVVDGVNLRAIAGDLVAPDLGLASQDRAEFAVDAIVHAAATVSWLASYSALRAANVLGTRALLELAAGHGVPFHYVSTISTAPPDRDEDSQLTLAEAQSATPYALSKWLAEQLVRRAGGAGLPVAIYRPAMIAGHSQRGVGNPDDFLSRYLAGMLELGRYLDCDDAVVDMTPVDFVADAIATLMVAHPRGGATYHLANLGQSLSYAGLGRAAIVAGAALTPATPAEFRAAIDRTPTSRLAPLAAFFPSSGRLAMGPWPCARTVATLANLGVHRPRIDDRMIATYLTALSRVPP